MAKFTGYLNLGTMFGVEIGSYLVDKKVDTMMNAGLSLFNQAEIYRRLDSKTSAETATKKACSIMNTLYAWKAHPGKRPPDCAVSWLDDAWCTLHQRYEELNEE